MWAIDRLLHMAMAHITSGNLEVTTAHGTTFSFGDRTGTPIAVRFTSPRPPNGQ